MSTEKKMIRRDKEVVLEFELQVKDIRQQLNEQLKCLDVRMETQVALVTEIQDYFRRRAEVELDYSRNLDKLAKTLSARHKAEKQKREQWHLFSTYACWQHLISSTKRQSRDHATLSELYSNNVVNRFTQTVEDIQRIYKRCREIGLEGHEEGLKVLHELHTAMKTYHTYHGEMKQSEAKLHIVENQLNKLEQTIPREKLEKSKKFRVIEKEIQKRQSKYDDTKLKALRARNEYLLCMEAANAAVRKYFVDDLSDLMDCMDFGLHNCIARTLMMYLSAEENIKRNRQSDIDAMNKCVGSLDSRVDKQKFLEYNNAPFMIPKKFEFQGHRGDEINYVHADKNIEDEMEARFNMLCKRLTVLKTESEEIWKTLETAEKSLMDMINTKDYDCSALFVDESKMPRNGPRQPETVTLKLRADKQETEEFYLSKFREYTMGSNLITRLQSKYEVMRKALGNDVIRTKDGQSMHGGTGVHKPHRNSFLSQKPKRKRIGRTPLVGQPRLFGGSLEEYLEATNQEIPLIMKSCIRIINLYGLHHQGVFRVSGAQVEINTFKESFERGEDPLSDVADASDINSVAGVFKLYLRELREPLFPIYYFDQFMDISKLESRQEFVSRVGDLLSSLPRCVYVVMRYLFAFLNHLSEFSDENMMDPYNLAICFGPTLLPIPEDKDQVQYQNLVNELMKNIIVYQEEIFTSEGGIAYEKYISSDVPDDNEVEEAPAEQMSEEDSEIGFGQSEDVDGVLKERDLVSLQIFGKSEVLEAVAQFDFTARSQRELSFKKGDTLTLYSQVSNDWWRGSFEGSVGLIPDKYIMLKIRDEDKDRTSSEENVKRRTSSSSDSLPGASPKLFSIAGINTRIIEEGSGISLSDGDHLNPLTHSRSTPHMEGAGIGGNLREFRGRSRSPSPRSLQCVSTSNTLPISPKSKEVIFCQPSADDNEVISESASLSSLTPMTTLTELVISEPDDGSVTVRLSSMGGNVSQDLQQDLDEALANVFSSIETLEKKNNCKRGPDAPDLVMDLPVNSSNPSSPSAVGKIRDSSIISPSTMNNNANNTANNNNNVNNAANNGVRAPGTLTSMVTITSFSSEAVVKSPLKRQGGPLAERSRASPELTTAERFALSNQCTMKKGAAAVAASTTTATMAPTGGNSATALTQGSETVVSSSCSADAQTQTIQALKRSMSTSMDYSSSSSSTASPAAIAASAGNPTVRTRDGGTQVNDKRFVRDVRRCQSEIGPEDSSSSGGGVSSSSTGGGGSGNVGVSSSGGNNNNTVAFLSIGGVRQTVSTFKPVVAPPPPVKTKPPVMKKPSLPVSVTSVNQSPETQRKVPEFKEIRQTTC